MGFNIPMNSKGALDASSLLSQLGGQLSNQSAQNNQMQNNGFSQPNNNFSQPNNNFSQPNNNFSQPNNNFSQPNNNFSQPNNNFSQPNNNFSQPNNNFSQPNNNFSQPNNNFSQPNNNFSQPNNNFSQPNNNFSQPNNPPQNAHPAAPQGGVHLKKGQKFSIAGQNGAAIQRIRMGLGWDVTNGACDLDASAFLLDQNGRIVGDTWFVFYGQTVSPDGSVMHSGDSKGMGAGDDETIDIDLNRLSQSVQRIAFVVTIDEALERGLNFSMVANAYVRILDANSNQELARFNLTDYYSNVTAMVVGELYRYNNTWKFNPVGDGVSKDLAGLCAMYGVNVAD